MPKGLVSCPDCGNRIAHDAARCPHCGADFVRRRARTIEFRKFIAALLFGAVLLAFTSYVMFLRPRWSRVPEPVLTPSAEAPPQSTPRAERPARDNNRAQRRQ
jgi:hypothetical protein